jgi:outer membrane receptor protein involved in Fe transport
MMAWRAEIRSALFLLMRLTRNTSLPYPAPECFASKGTYDAIHVPGYAVVDLMASIRLVDRLTAAVNVRNVGNEKYLGSLMWGQAFYAAPRSASVSLRFAY